MQARLVVVQSDSGCLSQFGTSPETHRIFTQYLTAEYRVNTEGRGRTVDEWKFHPEQPENHWLNGVNGCAVSASIQCCVLFGTAAPQGPTEPAVRLSALQRSKRG